MDYHKEYNRIMGEQTEIALATCIEGKPNVRIVNFCCDPNRNNLLYFSTFKDNPKVAEFAQNPIVAFTSVPHTGNAHVRVKNAAVKKSGKSVFDLKDEFCRKIPDYGMTIEQAGEHLILYELHFSAANVTIDLENSGDIVL